MILFLMRSNKATKVELESHPPSVYHSRSFQQNQSTYSLNKNMRVTTGKLLQLFLLFILVVGQQNNECPPSIVQQKFSKGFQYISQYPIMQSYLHIAEDSSFPLESIPFGVVSTHKNPEHRFPATRIGDVVISLQALENLGLFKGEKMSALNSKVFQGQYLNDFMSLDRSYWVEVRTTIQQLYSPASPIEANHALRSQIETNAQEVHNHLPVKIGDYTDFYSSRSHAFNVGSIIRGPANALNQNWLQIPIGYHGRASSIVNSGTPLRRPRGQVKAKDATLPSFSECKRLDFQVQMGAFIGGTTNELGKPLRVNEAWNNIFGFVVLNDWSFRDFQTWEYVPLGPFTAKNGLTTISPWIVTLQALSAAEVTLEPQDPTPLAYLQEKRHISYDISLQVYLKTKNMEKGDRIVTTNYKYMYWSCAQQLSHHSITGCNMQPGDLIGSGTISGPEKHEFGSLLELTWGGVNSLTLSNGQTRKFIEDGDSVVIKGYAINNGKKIGFGDCEGTVLPALPESEYYS